MEIIHAKNWTTYDSKPGDPDYSPLWRHNYVIVPGDYQAQSLRSKDDVVRSGYQIIKTEKSTIGNFSRAATKIDAAK